MNPAELAQILRVLGIIAGILQQLGVPGLMLILLGGPAAVLITVLVLNYLAQRRQEKVLNTYREDMAALVEAARIEADKRMETYRADTQQILRELGDDQRETAQYYKDNVELVKAYERLSKDLSDLVASNVRLLERLTGLITNNMFCPLVRERAHGSKLVD